MFLMMCKFRDYIKQERTCFIWVQIWRNKHDIKLTKLVHRCLMTETCPLISPCVTDCYLKSYPLSYFLIRSMPPSFKKKCFFPLHARSTSCISTPLNNWHDVAKALMNGLLCLTPAVKLEKKHLEWRVCVQFVRVCAFKTYWVQLTQYDALSSLLFWIAGNAAWMNRSLLGAFAVSLATSL